VSGLRDDPPEFLDLGNAGADEPEPLMVGDVHLWGPECPCGPTLNHDGSGLVHHSLDGMAWTEDYHPRGVSR
jgi:hypothetical protein